MRLPLPLPLPRDHHYTPSLETPQRRKIPGRSNNCASHSPTMSAGHGGLIPRTGNLEPSVYPYSHHDAASRGFDELIAGPFCQRLSLGLCDALSEQSLHSSAITVAVRSFAILVRLSIGWSSTGRAPVSRALSSGFCLSWTLFLSCVSSFQSLLPTVCPSQSVLPCYLDRQGSLS